MLKNLYPILLLFLLLNISCVENIIFIQVYPDGLESVRKSVENCEMMCGLDKNVMMKLLAGEWTQYTTLDHSGRQSKKIVIEYEIKQKEDDT